MTSQATRTPSTYRHRASSAAFVESRPDGGRSGNADLLTCRHDVAPRPLISVVIPVRNRRVLLQDTLDALSGQSIAGDQFEIIVVDDASEDGTAQMAAARAQDMQSHALVVARLRRRGGAAVARNAGIALARGTYIAFTDSDVVPDRDWLRNCLAAFSPGVGIVQGPTARLPGQAAPMFSHFVETRTFDGTFCTSNVAYRKEALLEAAGGFDRSCNYWEDADMGWRVRARGWGAVWAPDAVTYHQVIPLSPFTWLLQARRFYRRPAIVARHRGYRRHLTMRLWAEPWHAAFEMALLGVVIGRRRKIGWLLAAPYVAAFPFKRGLTGRWPLLKVAAHVAHDAVAIGSLVAGSIRYRTPVL